jgi:hypothetical protein
MDKKELTLDFPIAVDHECSENTKIKFGWIVVFIRTL